MADACFILTRRVEAFLEAYVANMCQSIWTQRQKGDRSLRTTKGVDSYRCEAQSGSRVLTMALKGVQSQTWFLVINEKTINI
jgi:hypothetical protein